MPGGESSVVGSRPGKGSVRCLCYNADCKLDNPTGSDIHPPTSCFHPLLIEVALLIRHCGRELENPCQTTAEYWSWRAP